MIRFFIDLYNFIRLKRRKPVFRIGFFSENNFIYEYLEPYILRKIKKHKILILGFEDINRDYLSLKNVFIFKTKLFQEIVFLTLNLILDQIIVGIKLLFMNYMLVVLQKDLNPV